MTETELERIVVRLVGDDKLYEKMLEHAETATKKAVNTIEGLGKRIEAFGKSMMRAGRSLTLALTTPIVTLGTLSVREFSKFDKAMTETFAKMGRVAPEVRKKMEDLAKTLSMSGQVIYDPTQLAKGYEELASAGLDAARSMKALPDVAKFAQAGAFDIGLAVKLIVGSMASFGKLSKDPEEFSKNLQKFSDVIVGVANETTTGVEQVARAMSADAAVAAREYGMALEDLGSILGVFALQNKDAEEAGNLTGRAIRLLTATFLKNKDVWQEMGIDLVDQATGKWVRFADAIGMLEKSFEGMTGPQRTATLMAMGFETLSLKAILPLIGQSKELKRQAELYKALGTTTEMAGIQMESFSAKATVVINNLKVAAIEIGESLVPALEQLGELIKRNTEYWRGLDESTKQTTITTIALVAAIGPLLIGLGSITWSIGQLVKVVALLGTGFAALRATIMGLGILGALHLTVAALAVAFGGLIYWLTRPVGNWIWGVTAFNDALKESIKLTAQVNSMRGARNQSEITDITNIQDPTQRKAAAGDAILVASRNLEGYKNAVKSAQREVNRLNTTWNWMVGAKPLEAANQDLKDAKVDAAQAAEHLEALKKIFKDIKEVEQEAAVDPKLEAAAVEAATLKEDIDKLSESLTEQINTMYMSANEAEIYKLKMRGATEQQLDWVNALAKTKASLDARDDLAEGVKDLTDRMKEQVDTFGMSATEVELYKLELQGATDAQLDMARASIKQLDELNRVKGLQEKAAEITKKYSDPQKKLIEEQAELNEMWMKGMINAEEYQKALADLGKEVDKKHVADFSVRGVDAVAAGSAEAISRIQAFSMSKSVSSTLSATQGLGSMPPLFNVPPESNTPIPKNNTISGTASSEELLTEIRDGVLELVGYAKPKLGGNQVVLMSSSLTGG